MSDHELDALARLYRQHAREAPAGHVDAQILALATRGAAAHRASHVWPWLAVGMAASLALVIGLHLSAVVTAPTGRAPADGPPPGYDDGRTRNYLVGMDIDPPASSVAGTLRDRMHTP